MWVAGYGPMALAMTGRVADGIILQLADPDLIRWFVGQVREAARAPAATRPRSGSRRPRRRTSATSTQGRERTRWFPALVSNHVVDLVNKYPREQLPPSLTGYIRDREGYDYHHHAEVGSSNAAFVGDEVTDRFCVLGTADEHVAQAARARGRRRGPVQPVPDERRRGGPARGLRPRRDPGARRRHGGRRAMSAGGTLIENGTIVNADGSQRRTSSSTARRSRRSGTSSPGRAARRAVEHVIDATGTLRHPGRHRRPHPHGAALRRHVRQGHVRDRDARGRVRRARPRSSTSRSSRAAQSLREGLDAWHAKAEGNAVVDYGFHMIMSDVNDDTLAEMDAPGRRGRHRLQAVHRLPGRLLLRRRRDLPGDAADRPQRRADHDARRERARHRRRRRPDRRGRADRPRTTTASRATRSSRARRPTGSSASRRRPACRSTSSTSRPATR